MDEKGFYHVQSMRFESCDLLANSNAYEQMAVATATASAAGHNAAQES